MESRDRAELVEALRALQMYDEVAPAVSARPLITRAQTAIGGVLRLECTAVDGTHVGTEGTCPIHEWLDPADQPKAEGLWGDSILSVKLDLDERSVMKRALRQMEDDTDDEAEADVIDRIRRRLGGHDDR